MSYPQPKQARNRKAYRPPLFDDELQGNKMISQVTIKSNVRQADGSEKERIIWFPLRTNHESLRQVMYVLEHKEFLFGSRLKAEKTESRDVYRVTDEYQSVIRTSEVVSVCEMQVELFDEDGKPVWTFDGGEASPRDVGHSGASARGEASAQ